MLKKFSGIVGGIAVVALAAGSFALGAHLRHGNVHGENLYKPPATLAAMPSRSALIPASYTTTASSTRQAKSDSPSSDGDEFLADGPGATFEQVYVLLQRNFVDGIGDESKLGHGAAAAMLASLQDPQSRFLEQSEMRELQQEQTGVYHGIGVVTTVRAVERGSATDESNPQYTSYQLTVVAPLPGTPAEKAGLKPGDVITWINGRWIAGYQLDFARAKDLKAAENDPVTFNAIVKDIQKQTDDSLTIAEAQAHLDNVVLPNIKATDAEIKDKPTGTLSLTVERPGAAKPLTISVENDKSTNVPFVTSNALPNNVGYIKINQFSEGTGKALSNALHGFGGDLRGLIVDLRNTPGGDIDAAADAAGKIGGIRYLGSVETKGDKQHSIAIASGRETSVNIHLVVLTNGGTANSAELLAAALKGVGAKLIGEKTFGDAMDVAPVELRDGSGFTLTVGKLYTTGGKTFQDTGITPDDIVANTTGGDEQMNAAIAALSGRIAGVPAPRG